MNYAISRKKVKEIMKSLGIFSQIHRKNKRYDPKNTARGFDNLINRNFRANKPYEKLYTDITYIESPYAKNGFFYLNAFIDGFDYMAYAPVLSEHPDTKLVIDSLKLLPLKKISLIHQDHGSQYTSYIFMKILQENNIIGSMSRIGNSLDNRPIEYF
jgi:transposase InsO family protein